MTCLHNLTMILLAMILAIAIDPITSSNFMNDSSDTWLQSELFKNNTQQSTASEVTEQEPVLDFYKREREG